MNVLIACEESGIVRDAFIARGHRAVSCDLMPTARPGPHYQGDIFDLLNVHAHKFDLMIAHPPCTHLSVSGARHFAAKRADGRQQQGIDFFMRLAKAKIKRKVIENPVCIMSSVWRKPDQVIQPWWFGHKETKATCLWLEGVPPLTATDVVGPPPDDPQVRKAWEVVHRMPPGPERAKLRSRTYQGIADAMAAQWGCDN